MIVTAARRYLASWEIRERRLETGPNELAVSLRSPVAWLWPLLSNPAAIVVLVVSGPSALLGRSIDAAVIASLLGVATAIKRLQTWRSDKSAPKPHHSVVNQESRSQRTYCLTFAGSKR